ncbi:transglycosylase domain-containing protein [Acidipropionibacterium virtanenii]|uniref:transglycosylase domain-containing protein n=1 Tax=Acidipropionibacterium virtanenii TaxID=2057246 RepID=UPI000DED357E|nr:transglycosylase domain-containing protein [Acidipropionibacterium virtanenii]
MAEPRRSSGRGPRHGKGRRSGSRVGLFVRRTLFSLLILVLVLAIAAGVGAIIFYNRTSLPDPNKDFQTNTSFIYFNDSKTKLGSLSVQNRQTVSYDQMPKSIKDAAISAENRTFWEDQGISVGGIVRAAWTIARGGEMQGGSTITQQYIKILYLSQDRTMQRKLKELVLAVKMGKQVPKQEILAGYLNTIYFGRGAYGIEAAAKSYFNVPASKLTIAQSAVLASVLNNPALFDPSTGTKARERLLNRYRYVLDGMLEAGNITQAQHDEYYRKLPTFPDVPINNRWAGTNGYLLKMVQNELLDDGFTDSQINGGGLRVTTTFDAAAQKAAVATGQKYKKIAGANAGKNGAKNLHPAIASVKVGTGEVLALYGGDDYIQNTRSWALQARPAASTFKTYAVVAGMRNGFSLKSALNGDTFTPRGDSVPIRNEFSEQYGTVSLQKATEDSINTAFVDMMTQIDNGPSAMVKAANDAGVPKGSGWDLNNRMPLGVAEVSPLDQATGYATIANQGKYVPSHVVAKVTDSSGKTLYTAKTTGKQTIQKDIAHDTTYALENVVNEGTGSAVSNLGYPVAGKTGTNGVGDDITSAWFVAYTRQISTAVMYVAGDSGNADLDPYAAPGDATFFGGTYPARAWADYMSVAMKGLPAKDFPDPDWVNLSGNHYGDTERETMSTSTPTATATSQPTTASSQPTTTATSQPSQQPTTSQPTATIQPTQEQTTSEPTQTQSAAPPNPGGGETSTTTAQKPAAATTTKESD